nr:MgtC/SapB family protein [candidate division Zixibacteria bacterium]
MDNLTVPFELRFFIALGLSFLIGLERERSGMISKGRVFAGVRTYSLIGVFGFGCAWLYNIGAEWMLPVGLIAMTSLALVGYLAKLRQGHVGWTSEVAAILTFIIGALCLLADIWVPMALGIIATFLLSEKAQIEDYVESLDKAEFLAVVKFLIVTLIILPVLPNQEYTQFNLNPRHIWQIVVLVSSLGFAGYFLSKKFGDRIGLKLSGILGGIVSSTVITITAGRIARKTPEQSGDALQASILAGSVMYLRILVLIWIIKPEFVTHIWLKLVILAAVGVALALFIKKPVSFGQKPIVKSPPNPFEIKPALIFASLFVFLTVVTMLIRRFYGAAGLLVLAGITGVTDIDPFILSLVNNAAAFQALLLKAIIVSMMSNTIMKGIYFGYLAREIRGETAWRYGLWALLHLPVILIN